MVNAPQPAAAPAATRAAAHAATHAAAHAYDAFVVNRNRGFGEGLFILKSLWFQWGRSVQHEFDAAVEDDGMPSEGPVLFLRAVHKMHNRLDHVHYAMTAFPEHGMLMLVEALRDVPRFMAETRESGWGDNDDLYEKLLGCVCVLCDMCLAYEREQRRSATVQ